MLGGMTTCHRLTAAVLCVLVLAAGASACREDDSSSSPSGGTSTTSPSASRTPAVCADVDALRASAEKIKAAEPGQGALATLSTQLTAMLATLEQLPADAATQYSERIDAIKTATHSLESSLRTAQRSPSAATLSAVRADVRALGDAVRGLVDAVGSTC
jgi:hypothetical protein